MAGPKFILYVWFCFAHCVTSICLERDFCANGDYRESFLLQSKWVFRSRVFYSTCLVVSSVRGKCLPFLRECTIIIFPTSPRCFIRKWVNPTFPEQEEGGDLSSISADQTGKAIRG